MDGFGVTKAKVELPSYLPRSHYGMKNKHPILLIHQSYNITHVWKYK